MSTADLRAQVERVYQTHAHRLYRIAYSVLLSRESAEDAVQEVFAKYISHPPAFSDEEHEKAWLIRVTINQCHDLQRSGKVRAYTPLSDLAEVLPAQADKALQEAETGSVLRAVLALPEKYREVLVLYALEENTVAEVALTLRLTASAVKMRLKRARALLKQQLEKEDMHV